MSSRFLFHLYVSILPYPGPDLGRPEPDRGAALLGAPIYAK